MFSFLCLCDCSGQRHYVSRMFMHLSDQVCPKMHFWAELARYLGYLLTEFGQTFTANGLWCKDECFKFWDQKVKGQGRDEVKYAP